MRSTAGRSRKKLDEISANAAQAAASIPGLGTPTAVQTVAGTPATMLTLPFAPVAALPAAWSQIKIGIFQGNAQHRVEGRQLASPLASTTLSLCVSVLVAGVSTNVDFERRDVFGSTLRRSLTITF